MFSILRQCIIICYAKYKMAFDYYPTSEEAQKAIQAQAPFFRTFLTVFVGSQKVIEALDKLMAALWVSR